MTKELYGGDMGKYRKKGMTNQHHSNYGKRATKKQQAAQIRNFDIFRLRGIKASLENIASHDGLSPLVYSYISDAANLVNVALIAETGK